MSSMRCPGQDPRFMAAKDVREVKCPQCGRAVELWPDEPQRKCPSCGHPTPNPALSLKCLEWCRFAEKCLAALRGEESAGMEPLREELIGRMKHTFGNDERRIQHALSVLELAERIAQRSGADPLVVVPAAILHDIGYAAEQGGLKDFDHGQEGCRIAAGLLDGLGLPDATRDEILDLIRWHHDRQKMDTRNGAPLYDADLIVNLSGSSAADRERALKERALTAAGRAVGAEFFGGRMRPASSP